MAKDVLLERRGDRPTWDLVDDGTGSATESDSAMHAVLSQLLDEREGEGRGGWLWDETGKHGSLLWTLGTDNGESRARFVAYALDALDVLVEEGEIVNPQARVEPARVAGRLDGVISWTTPTGRPEELRVPLVI